MPKASEAGKARTRGFRAYTKAAGDITLTKCPYAYSSLLYTEWRIGWEDAAVEAAERNYKAGQEAYRKGWRGLVRDGYDAHPRNLARKAHYIAWRLGFTHAQEQDRKPEQERTPEPPKSVKPGYRKLTLEH